MPFRATAPTHAADLAMDDDADPPALPPSGEQHGHPEEGMECLATMEDITTEDGNYCEYQTALHYVDTCDTCTVPRLCRMSLRRRAACPVSALQYVRRTRTSLGRTVRTACRGTTRVPSKYSTVVPTPHPALALALTRRRATGGTRASTRPMWCEDSCARSLTSTRRACVRPTATLSSAAGSARARRSAHPPF